MASPTPTTVPPSGMPPTSPGGTAQNVTYYVYQMQAPTEKEINVDWTVCFTQYFLRALLNFLNFGAWVLLVAGVSQCQSECNKGSTPIPFTDFFSALALNNAVQPTNSDCIKYLSLTWWAVWLQFVTVVIATITMFQFFARYKQLKAIFTTTMYFFIMSTVLLFFIADKYSNSTYIIVNSAVSYSAGWKAGTTLLTVGAITSLVFNFFWIMWNSYADVPSFPGQAAPPVLDVEGNNNNKDDAPTVTATTA